MSFLVTGLGKCGSLWLATLLQKSKTWSIRHEPDKEFFDIIKTNKRLQNPHYGEITTYSRFEAHKAISDVYVIVRDPLYQIGPKYKEYNNKEVFFDRFKKDYLILDHLIQDHNAVVISFRKMVSDWHYLTLVVKALGVRDVVPTLEDMQTKINTRKNTSIEDKSFLRSFQWFRDKYAEYL